MATLADALNKIVNPGVNIPGAKSRIEEEAQRQLALQAAEKARVAQKPVGAAAATIEDKPTAPVTPSATPSPASVSRPAAASISSASAYSPDKTLRVSEPSAMPQEIKTPAARASTQAPAALAISRAPDVIDTTKDASPFVGKDGRAPEPGSWDALWEAKRRALRDDAQNRSRVAALGAGSAALQAENAPLISAAAQEAATERSREQMSMQRDISAAEIGQRAEAAKQTAEQLKRQIISVPTGQRLDTSVPGMPIPVNTYAYFTQDESGKRKQISIDPMRGAAAAAPPKGAVDLLKQTPSMAKDFNAKYGPGAAEAILGK